MKAGSSQAESCCVYVKPQKIMQHMYGIIPKLFDCWANPVAHLLLLKSSMDRILTYIARQSIAECLIPCLAGLNSTKQVNLLIILTNLTWIVFAKILVLFEKLSSI